MATTTSPSISPAILSLSSVLRPKHISPSSIVCDSQHPPPPTLSSQTRFCSQTPLSATPFKAPQKWRISAFPRNLLLLEEDPIENSQLLESTSADDGVSSIISVLLCVAFIGLSILTIGVIYIAVTDFLQKRERDKFDKEEAAKKKRSKKEKSELGLGLGQEVSDKNLRKMMIQSNDRPTLIQY